jgi:hypothetical protein
MITKFKLFLNENVLIDYGIDNIINDYFVTALFTGEDTHQDLINKNKTIYDFSDDARKQAKEEIEWFINTAIELDKDIFEDISDDSVGGYIWYQRNGHGVGFWDDIYDKQKNELIRILLAQLGEIDIEVGDDDKIYFFGGSKKYKTFNIEEYLIYKKAKKYNIL